MWDSLLQQGGHPSAAYIMHYHISRGSYMLHTVVVFPCVIYIPLKNIYVRNVSCVRICIFFWVIPSARPSLWGMSMHMDISLRDVCCIYTSFCGMYPAYGHLSAECILHIDISLRYISCILTALFMTYLAHGHLSA